MHPSNEGLQVRCPECQPGGLSGGGRHVGQVQIPRYGNAGKFSIESPAADRPSVQSRGRSLKRNSLPACGRCQGGQRRKPGATPTVTCQRDEEIPYGVVHRQEPLRAPPNERTKPGRPARRPRIIPVRMRQGHVSAGVADCQYWDERSPSIASWLTVPRIIPVPQPVTCRRSGITSRFDSWFQ